MPCVRFKVQVLCPRYQFVRLVGIWLYASCSVFFAEAYLCQTRKTSGLAGSRQRSDYCDLCLSTQPACSIKIAPVELLQVLVVMPRSFSSTTVIPSILIDATGLSVAILELAAVIYAKSLGLANVLHAKQAMFFVLIP